MGGRDSAKFIMFAAGERGYTVLEMAFVLLIAGVIMTIAAPPTKTALQSYHLGAAVKDVSGAILSTRYLAIMKGSPYNIAFTQNTNTYQIPTRECV
jgi:prepilin-type N-terminal cleavage/methylation domain-containing protein